MPHTFYSLDDVHKMFPADLKLKRSELDEAVEHYGCYRVFPGASGRKFMMPEDVDRLLKSLRAKPTSAESGPGMLYGYKPAPDEMGTMIFIGDQVAGDGSVFIAWAPIGRGATDMLKLVQFGNDQPLAILHFFAATWRQVEEHKKVLNQFRVRSDVTSWFMRSKKVNDYILKLRDDAYGQEADEPEDTD